MADWQPIKTAPKDGTDVLLTVSYNGGELKSTRMGAWRQRRPGEFAWLQHHTFDPFSGEVTHWMPMPDPAP